MSGPGRLVLKGGESISKAISKQKAKKKKKKEKEKRMAKTMMDGEGGDEQEYGKNMDDQYDDGTEKQAAVQASKRHEKYIDRRTEAEKRFDDVQVNSL